MQEITRRKAASECGRRRGIDRPVEAAIGGEVTARLALVIARLPLNAAVKYLSSAHEQALLNWDAEHYRQQMTSNRRPEVVLDGEGRAGE